MIFHTDDPILFLGIIFKEQIFADDNITTSTVSVPNEQVSVVYTGKWLVFNDPNLDQQIIPEDEEEKEALRVGLLVTDWWSMEDDGKTVFGGRLNVDKLVTYYYTDHNNRSVPMRICQPIQFEGSPMFYFCHDYTEEMIIEHELRGTFLHIWRYKRDLFISNIVFSPIIFVTGVFGKTLFYSKY